MLTEIQRQLQQNATKDAAVFHVKLGRIKAKDGGFLYSIDAVRFRATFHDLVTNDQRVCFVGHMVMFAHRWYNERHHFVDDSDWYVSKTKPVRSVNVSMQDSWFDLRTAWTKVTRLMSARDAVEREPLRRVIVHRRRSIRFSFAREWRVDFTHLTTTVYDDDSDGPREHHEISVELDDSRGDCDKESIGLQRIVTVLSNSFGGAGDGFNENVSKHLHEYEFNTLLEHGVLIY